MTNLSEQQCRQALATVDSQATREVMNNADLMAMFVGITNGSLAALEGGPAAALGIADKWATVTDAAGKAAGNTMMTTTAASAQIITQSLSLIKLGSAASPGMVVATVGAMFTKKVALMFGLVPEDKTAKLVAAIADLTSSVLIVGTSVAAVSASATAVPVILLVGAVAQLGASGYQAYTNLSAD
jgi:hypothetical protein